jgi:hypothetical protein
VRIVLAGLPLRNLLCPVSPKQFIASHVHTQRRDNKNTKTVTMRLCRGPDPLFRLEPLQYLSDTLQAYNLSWTDLRKAEFTPTPGQCSKAHQQAWYRECRRGRVCAAVAEHYLAERKQLPKYLQACLPGMPEEMLRRVAANKVTPFMVEHGDLARAALRLQAPTLAVAPSNGGEPMCHLCSNAQESAMHLLHDCPGLPQDMIRERREVNCARAFEVQEASPRGILRYGLAHDMGPAWSASLKWDGMKSSTASRLLWLAGRAIDFYSKQVAPLDPESGRRRWNASRVRPCQLSPVCRGVQLASAWAQLSPV